MEETPLEAVADAGDTSRGGREHPIKGDPPHKYTVWALLFVPRRKNIRFPTTEPNRLMLCGETVAVHCENRTEHINTLCGYFSTYLTGDTLRLHYRAQPVNAVWGNSRCLL
jgi:hypothetical protein